MIQQGRKLLDTWSLTVHIPILVEICQRQRFSFLPHKMLSYYIPLSKCCRFSQEQHLRVTTLKMISIPGDCVIQYWIQRAQHTSSRLCTELQPFFFFVLSHTFRLDYYVPAVRFQKFLCKVHSGQYHPSRKDRYSFHLIMITFFFWVSVCAFLKISSS